LDVTLLITQGSRVITFDAFGITEECDAPVICDELLLPILPGLKVF